MLIQCPECKMQISDKADFCPHCGYRPNIKRRSTSNHRKRLPNGFGQISEIKGSNLRKPFRAMVTVGKTEEGRPICKLLKPEAYFKTYNEAYEALMKYHRNPYDYQSTMTVGELHDLWLPDYLKRVKAYRGTTATANAWNYCSSAENIRVVDLKPRHIRYCMDHGTHTVYGVERTPSDNTKRRIKQLFNMMLDYAVEYEIVDRNISRGFTVTENKVKVETKKPHIAFTREEMDTLWGNIEVPYVDVILINCYSGWRPQELATLLLENINLIEWTFTGGMKTEYGTNRIVPIHSRIRPLVQRWYNSAKVNGSKYLFGFDTYAREKETGKFNNVVKTLNLNPNHRPHDCRVQFVTMAKEYQVDEYAIKRIVGHSIQDLTERVYTKRDLNWLSSEIEKIV